MGVYQSFSLESSVHLDLTYQYLSTLYCLLQEELPCHRLCLRGPVLSRVLDHLEESPCILIMKSKVSLDSIYWKNLPL